MSENKEKRGGTRKGSGRKPQGGKSITVVLMPKQIKLVNKQGVGSSFSEKLRSVLNGVQKDMFE